MRARTNAMGICVLMLLFSGVGCAIEPEVTVLASNGSAKSSNADSVERGASGDISSVAVAVDDQIDVVEDDDAGALQSVEVDSDGGDEGAGLAERGDHAGEQAEEKGHEDRNP